MQGIAAGCCLHNAGSLSLNSLFESIGPYVCLSVPLLLRVSKMKITHCNNHIMYDIVIFDINMKGQNPVTDLTYIKRLRDIRENVNTL